MVSQSALLQDPGAFELEALTRKRRDSSYPEEIIHTKRQIAALGKGVHHQEAIDMQTERVGEEEDYIAVGPLRVRSGDVCVDTLNLRNGSCRVSAVKSAFQAAQVGRLCQYVVHS